jgi:hypothetical protein
MTQTANFKRPSGLAAGTKHTALGGDVHRPLEHRIGRGCAWHRTKHEIIAYPRLADDRRVDVAAAVSANRQNPE